MTRFNIVSTIDRLKVAHTSAGKHYWNIYVSGDRVSGPLILHMTTAVNGPLTRKLKRLSGQMMLFKGVMVDGELFAVEVRPADDMFPYVRIHGDGTVVRVLPFYGAQKLVVRTDIELHIGLINNGTKVEKDSVIRFSATMRNGYIVASRISVERHPQPSLDITVYNPAVEALIEAAKAA